MTRKQTNIIVVGVALCLILVAGAWFLAVRPQMNKRAQNGAAAAAARQATAVQRTKIADLTAKKHKLDQAAGQLDQIAQQFPADFDQPEWVKVVTDAARNNGVQLDSINPSVPEVLTNLTPAGAAGKSGTTNPSTTTPGAAPPPAPAPTTPGTTTSGSGTTGTAPGVASSAANAGALVAMSSVTINATGPVDNLRRFLAALSALPRPLLVDSATITATSRTSGGSTGSGLAVTGRTFLIRALPRPGETPAP